MASALQTLFRQVPYAVAPLLSDLLLEPVDEIGADRVAQRLRAVLPSDLQEEDVAVEEQAAQITSQLQLAHAIMQDGQTELAALGAWRRHSEATLIHHFVRLCSYAGLRQVAQLRMISL